MAIHGRGRAGSRPTPRSQDTHAIERQRARADSIAGEVRALHRKLEARIIAATPKRLRLDRVPLHHDRMTTAELALWHEAHERAAAVRRLHYTGTAIGRRYAAARARAIEAERAAFPAKPAPQSMKIN